MSSEPELRRVNCPHCGGSTVVGVMSQHANCTCCYRLFECPPWDVAQARAATERGRLFHHPPEVLAFVEAIEQLCQTGPRAVVQQALAAALWRITNREGPTAHDCRHELTALVLRQGGRELVLELVQLPEPLG